MYIKLTYYSDGSSNPDIEFYPAKDVDNLIGDIIHDQGLMKTVRVFLINELEKNPEEIQWQDERVDK